MHKNYLHVGNYSNTQLLALTFLRFLIGWHFLYEGLVKFYTSGWTARSYLTGAVGPLGSMFRNIASHELLLKIVDILNEWGLLLIGLSLFIGLLTKPAKIFGILLLLFYYLAYPPFAGFGDSSQLEGNYWVVNKILIEIAALVVLYSFPTSQITGIDRFLLKRKEMHYK